jgi:SAM-dependent methyltransferase
VTAKAPLRPFLRQNPYPLGYTEGFFYREKMRAIHRIAPDRTVAEVLEVGGGTSGLTSLLYPGAKVTNADLDPSCGDSAVNSGPGRTFVVADATALPFAEASFEAVTMFDVIEHVVDHAKAIEEARRVLRPGGFLLVTTPNERWRFPYHRALRPICPTEEELIARWRHVRRGYAIADLARLTGVAPAATATFIGPVTSIAHDIGFSRLGPRLRRAACAVLSPITWVGYLLQPTNGPGTETASCWFFDPCHDRIAR